MYADFQLKANLLRVFVCFDVLFVFFLYFLGIDDPQTVFTLFVVSVTILFFVARVCFGMFKRFGPHKVNIILYQLQETLRFMERRNDGKIHGRFVGEENLFVGEGGNPAMD